MKKLLLPLGMILALSACKTSSNGETNFSMPGTGEPTEVIEYDNPPGEDFNIEGSSPIAILIADQVMNAMGGRATWDQTNVLYWNFFGARTLLWDKANNRVRVDMPGKDMTIALNLTDQSGNVWRAGNALTNPDSVAKYLQRGREIWINDSYWLVMPFKLKDSGVTLTYEREDTTMTGEKADVLRLTFENVGVTPNNAYEVWVDVERKLVTQWAFFRNADQEEPNFVLPWGDYQDYHGLLLSGDRGERDLTDIQVLKKAPKGAFDSPDPLKL